MDIGFIEIMIGSGTLGSIATMGVQKLFSRKKDKIDVSQSQLNFFAEMNEKLSKSIEKFEDIVCYTPKCDFRINSVENHEKK